MSSSSVAAASGAASGAARAPLLPVLRVSSAEVTHPTGDPKFSVMQAFPAAVSAEEADPYLMCDHFGPTIEKTGPAKHADDFPISWHPHRGMDIATYMVEGTGRHADSMGNASKSCERRPANGF